MAVYENYGMEVNPPSDYTRYGEGNFLIQCWGKSVTFTKNGRAWYTQYMSEKEFSYGQDYYVNDETANDNNKDFNTAFAPIALHWVSINYNATGTAGTRELVLSAAGSSGGNSNWVKFGIVTASQSKNYILGSSGSLSDMADSSNIYVPVGLPFGSVINEKFSIYDKNDVDDNDDMYIYIRGWLMTHKNVENIIVKNCTDLQVEYNDPAGLEGTSYGWFLNVIPLP